MDVTGNGQNNFLFALRRDNLYYSILSSSGPLYYQFTLLLHLELNVGLIY